MSVPVAQQGQNQAQAQNPAYAYIIRYSASQEVFCMTSYDQPITIAGLPAWMYAGDPQTFQPMQIGHGEIENAATFEKRTLQVVVGSNDEKLRRYFTTAPAEKINVAIIRLSSPALLTGETLQYATDGFPIASGVIGSVGFQINRIACTITPEPFLSNRGVPRMFFSRSCNYVLGGPGCGVNREAFMMETTISELDRAQRIVTFSAAPPGGDAEFFRSGYLVHVPTGTLIGIVWSDADGTAGRARAKLHFWSPDLQVGHAVKAYAGCRHTPADCENKFNNLDNFGGFSDVPNRNPMMHGIR